MRIGARTVLSAIVLGCVLLSAGTVHVLWRRTADANSRTLAAALSRQIAAAVRSELTARIMDAESAYGAVRTIFVQNVIDSREADKREFVFLSQLQAQPELSWICFGWPEGTFFGAHKLGDHQLEMVEIGLETGMRQLRTDRYKVYPQDIQFEARAFGATDYDVRQQPWYQDGAKADKPAWYFVNAHPGMKRGAVAFAGPVDVYGERQGVLSVMIDLNRISRFLSGLMVGQRGGAFVLGPDGSIVAGPDKRADEVTAADFSNNPLRPVAELVGSRLAAAAANAGTFDGRVESDGAVFQVDLTPTDFRGWQIAVVIPEQEFLGEVDRATTRLVIGLALFVLAAALVSVFASRQLIGRPLSAIAGDLALVEGFDVDRIAYRPSSVKELDTLSSALVRMAAGLAAFGKYLPRDVVRMLVAQGVEAKPGGETKPLTILFADIAGFTGMSERLAEAIVPLISEYLEIVSACIHREGGTIDKFIGDAVMAFWGAPQPDPDHAFHACRAALVCVRAIRTSGLVDDIGNPLCVRIGINSGIAVVGNVGSESRLNYTALGDTVNVASQLEGINKIYDTTLLIGAETRQLAGERIIVREVDRVAVYGRSGGSAIYELLGLAGEDTAPPWISDYETGLALYRAREWSEALSCFERALSESGGDGPSRLMIARCQAFLETPPPADWSPVNFLDSK